MITKGTLVHCVIHALLIAFLLVSLGFNYAFMNGDIYIDYEVTKKNKDMNDVFNPEEKGVKHGR